MNPTRCGRQSLDSPSLAVNTRAESRPDARRATADRKARLPRSLIAISTDTPLDDVAVHITSITVPGVGDVAEKAQRSPVSAPRLSASRLPPARRPATTPR